MGPIQQIAAVATTATPMVFTLLLTVLGALFFLIMGGYTYTYKGLAALRKLITNHLEHRLEKMEKRISDLEN